MLMVHCKSKDDDLGPHFVPANNEYEFRFKPGVFKQTLFWCHVAAPNNRKATFDVFNNKLIKNEIRNNLYWKLKDDGVYLSAVDNFSHSHHDQLVKHWD
ncbi:S-protein homolog 5 [Linum grandiflorum]